jgi:hypothetical protein
MIAGMQHKAAMAQITAQTAASQLQAKMMQQQLKRQDEQDQVRDVDDQLNYFTNISQALAAKGSDIPQSIIDSVTQLHGIRAQRLGYAPPSEGAVGESLSTLPPHLQVAEARAEASEKREAMREQAAQSRENEQLGVKAGMAGFTTTPPTGTTLPAGTEGPTLPPPPGAFTLGGKTFYRPEGGLTAAKKLHEVRIDETSGRAVGVFQDNSTAYINNPDGSPLTGHTSADSLENKVVTVPGDNGMPTPHQLHKRPDGSLVMTPIESSETIFKPRQTIYNSMHFPGMGPANKPTKLEAVSPRQSFTEDEIARAQQLQQADPTAPWEKIIGVLNAERGY